MRHQRAALIAAFCLAQGCAFTGIGEGLEQQTCADEAPTFCDDLNQLRPTGDDCLRWSCDRSLERPVCAVLPRDMDNDGAPAAECAPAGVTADCDDDESRRSPDLTETCDGLDNDCDDVVDEGTYSFGGAVQLVQLESRGQNVRFATAASGDKGAIVLSVLGGASDRSPRAAFFDTLAPATPGGDVPLVALAGGSEFSALRVAGTGLWFDENGDAVGLLAEVSGGAGSGRLFSGSLTRATTMARAELSTTATHFADGFADSSPSGYLSVSHNAPRTAAVVAFLGVAPSPTAPCGSGTYPVFASAMTSSPAQPSTTTVSLGTATDPSPPAVLALDDSGDRFIVAFADAATTTNDIVVMMVNRAGQTLSLPVGGGELYREVTTSTPGEVALVLGDQRVALLYRDGCAATANVRARVLALDQSTPSLTAPGDVITLAAGGSADREPRRPAGLWHSQPAPGWWFGWERGRATLELAIATADGAIIGEPIGLPFADSTPSGLSLVEAGADVTVVAYTENTTEARFGVWAAPLACQQ